MYSKEFRREVLAACDEGGTTRVVATRFGVSESWVRRIKQERRESGKTAPCTTRKRSHAWDGWMEWLKKKVSDRPDIYLHEVQAALKEEQGVQVSQQTISRALREAKITRKKRR